MINDPCGFCGVAYGHKAPCPDIIQDSKVKTKATEDWQRGKEEAEKGQSAKSTDKANAHYMLGRDFQELEAKGLVPKRRRRSIRAPIKSEPRMASVTSIARADS